MTPNKWNLVAAYRGVEAKSRAVHPVLERSLHSFPANVAEKAERLEIWTLPTSNPGLAAEEYEALLFDPSGNRLGQIYVREDYDVDIINTDVIPSDRLVLDDVHHARVRGQM